MLLVEIGPDMSVFGSVRFERISSVHYALKTLAYTMINLRHFCG